MMILMMMALLTQTPEHRHQMLPSTATHHHHHHQDELYGSPTYHTGSLGVLPQQQQFAAVGVRPSTADLRLLGPPPLAAAAAALRRPGPAAAASVMGRSDERDEAYRERRRKNNEAAKRSRDTRRLKELQVGWSVSLLVGWLVGAFRDYSPTILRYMAFSTSQKKAEFLTF